MGLDRNEIAEQLRDKIASGEFPPGYRLPSQRQLADDLGAAPNTVGAAIRLLATEGLVDTREKSRAVVRNTGERESREDRVSAARADLVDIRATVRTVRDELTGIEDRLAAILSKLRD